MSSFTIEQAQTGPKFVSVTWNSGVSTIEGILMYLWRYDPHILNCLLELQVSTIIYMCLHRNSVTQQYEQLGCNFLLMLIPACVLDSVCYYHPY